MTRLRREVATTPALRISRRTFFKGTGALVVTFSLLDTSKLLVGTAAAQPAPGIAADRLTSWLAVNGDGTVTVYVGKVELGTGVETALAQIAAEELDVALTQVRMVQGDTDLTVNQGATVGSQSIATGGAQLRAAAAEGRQALVAMAATRLNVPAEQLIVRNGVVSVAGAPAQQVAYAELVGNAAVDVTVSGTAPLKDPATYTIVGQSVPRLDIPAKMTGRFQYVQQIRLPGMLHGRMVHPTPQSGATLVSVDESSVSGLPGVERVFVQGNIVGVVAQREEQALRAARDLKVTWSAGSGLPAERDLYTIVRNTPSQDRVIAESGDFDTALSDASRTLRATYEFPFQSHGMIGPVTAVADVGGGRATVWSGTQFPAGLKAEIARWLDLPSDRVRIIYVEGSGCYGRYTVDDAALEAALLSRAVDRPVRVQWSRHDEHGWDHYNPAMLHDLAGTLDAGGEVTGWSYDMWTGRHTGAMLLGNDTGGTWTRTLPGNVGDDTPNFYHFDHRMIVLHAQETAILRYGNNRSLGAIGSTFAAESFMDELAAAANADPVAFRQRYLSEERALDVLEAAADLAGWAARPSPQRAPRTGVLAGRGIALAEYGRTWVAMVAEVEVDTSTGQVRVVRVSVAHDCGLAVNPDGVRNQIEGNVVQSISRTLKEDVHFDREGVTTLDWQSYPILTFSEVPDVQIALLNRRNARTSGAGEAATAPTSAAIANAIFDATGARLRRIPFTADRVKAALA